MSFLITFILLSLFNVVFSTIKSIITIKGGKLCASLVSGSYYAFYNVMLIYTVADFPLWQKCLITFVCNVIGVWTVKFFEEKGQKEKLWKIECTIPTKHLETLDFDLREVPHSYIRLSDKHTLFNFYCATQKESAKVKTIADQYGAKFFVAESKTLS